MADAWCGIRLVRRGNVLVVDPYFQEAGQFLAFYPVHPTTGQRANADGISLDFGGSDCRTTIAHVKVTDIPDAAQRALVRPDRRKQFRRRFYLDLVAVGDAAPSGQYRKWVRDMLDPSAEMTHGEIMQRTVAWSLMWPFIKDRRTDAVVPDEQTILDWDPVTGLTPPLPADWVIGDPDPGDPTDV